MITRSTIMAIVYFEKIWKDADGVHTETMEEKIPKCENKEKAEIILTKEHKGSIVSIIDAQFIMTTRGIEDEKFDELSTIIAEEFVDEKPTRTRKKKGE